jgi:hypothetical protein
LPIACKLANHEAKIKQLFLKGLIHLSQNYLTLISAPFSGAKPAGPAN